jgi:phosphoglycerate dehydrogenase-like enzyme
MDNWFDVAFTRDYLDDDGHLAYGDIGLHLLEETPTVTYRFLDIYEDPVSPEQIKDIDGLSLIYPRVTARTFVEGADRLVIIARCGAGYDKIDVKACTESDVLFVNAANALRLPTAAAALMYMLVLAKGLWRMDRMVRRGNWDERANIEGIEIEGRTLGIVGFGSIGRELARLVAPFRMRILAYGPRLDEEVARQHGAESVTLEDLLLSADFVSLHCPLTDETRQLIGSRELAMMKPTAYLINLARGPVVAHDALVEALQKRWIAGAGLDVFEEEPLPADDPLTGLENVILSPHWAAGTLDVFERAGASNIQAMLHIARGQIPKHVVNREVLDRPGFRAKLARFQARESDGGTPGSGCYEDRRYPDVP